MGAFEHQIEELVAFARDRNGNDRSVLFCELTDIFMSGNAPARLADREHLLDVIEALVPHVAPNTRASVASQLADMPHPPMDLVMRLIYDDAALVSSLIAAAPLDEDTLIEFIARTGREHHQELATRDDLSANVWIALARAAPSVPSGNVHNEQALWDESLGKDKGKKNISSPKNARDLGLDLFMTRPAPLWNSTSKQQPRSVALKSVPLNVVQIKNDKNADKKEAAVKADKDISLQKTSAAEDRSVKEQKKEASGRENFPENDDYIFGKKIANDMGRIPLSRQERRTLDENVHHPLPHGTASSDAFDWKQHVSVDTGWALFTDHKHEITDLNQSAKTFMGPASERLLGMSLFELIGLASRPEHPVVQAIKRHGTIHEAPVVLFVGPVGRASWTLTAIPSIDDKTEEFEGYNCHFSPVPVAKEDLPVFLDEIAESDEPVKVGSMGSVDVCAITGIAGEVPAIVDASDIFGDTSIDVEDIETPKGGITQKPRDSQDTSFAVAPDDGVETSGPQEKVIETGASTKVEALAKVVAENMGMSIDAVRQQAKELAHKKMEEIQARLANKDIKEWPGIIMDSADAASIPAADEVYNEDPLHHIFGPAPLSEQSGEDFRKTVSRDPELCEEKSPEPAFKEPCQSPDQAALDDLHEAIQLSGEAIRQEEKKQKMHMQRIDTIKHMLSMMEQVENRLKNKSSADDPVTLQLDADIARACSRALRELLRQRI